MLRKPGKILHPGVETAGQIYPSMKGYFDFKDLQFDLTEGNGGFVETIELKNNELLLYNTNPNTRDSSKNIFANKFLEELLPDYANDICIYGSCIIIAKELVRK